MLLNIPVIANDVAGFGEVFESTAAEARENIMFSSNRVVYRLDRTGDSLNIINDTTNATSGTSNAFSPFGANVIPNSATLKIYDSVDGVWGSNALLTADISLLKSTGWKTYEFGENANRRNWRPSFDPSSNIPERRYIRFELDDGSDKDSFIAACGTHDIIALALNVTQAGSATQPVKVSEVALVRKESDREWTDATSVYNGSLAQYTAANQTGIAYSGTEILIGFDNIAYSLAEYMYRRQGALSGVTWKVYLSGPGETWLDITSSYTSGSNFKSSGPSVSQVAAEKFISTWTPPSTWTKRIVPASATSRYWLRFVMALANVAPFETAVHRARAFQYGNDNTQGMGVGSAASAKAVSIYIRGVKSGTGDRRFDVVNLTTGQSRSVTIPGATVQGQGLQFDFPAVLPFAAVDKVGIIPINGGAAYQDVNIRIVGV